MPAISLYGESVTGDRLTTSASDPRLPFRFWKCVASVAAQADPVSPIASIERQSPLSLPRKISSGFAAFQASACWYSATCALMQVVEFVVLRQTQPIGQAALPQVIRAGQQQCVLLRLEPRPV